MAVGTVAVEHSPHHRFAPRGSAAALFGCRADEVLLAGPAGTGKSRACLEKLHMAALLNPGMRGLIVRKVRDTLGSTALVTWREHVIREALTANPPLVSFYGGSAEEPPQYRYANGSAIVVGGMDKAIKIMSSEYDMIYAQEATELTLDDLEKLITRLRNGVMSFQQLMLDANPDSPVHWLKQRCDAGRTVLFECQHEENPRLFDGHGVVTAEGRAYLAKLDALTGVRYQRLRRGLWVAAEGIIYEDWDPTRHIVDRDTIPPEWARIWSVDFGYVNPFVAQCWARDPEGRLILEWEIYRTQRTVDQHATDIMAVVSKPTPNYRHPPGADARRAHHGRTWTAPRPSVIVCDHDAEGRAVLERELGMSTIAAHKSVLEGIQAVQARIRADRILLRRGALVTRDAALVDAVKPCSTADEMLGYVWDTGAGKKTKETPLKVDDHGMDALRYIVANEDLKGRPRVRMM